MTKKDSDGGWTLYNATEETEGVCDETGRQIDAPTQALFDQVIDVADLVKMPDDRDTGRVYRDKDGDYVLTGGGYGYEIERRRINTGPKLVEWVLHLIRKEWATLADIEALMEMVIDDHPRCIDRNA